MKKFKFSLVLFTLALLILSACCEPGANGNNSSKRPAPKFKVGEEILLRPNNVKAIISGVRPDWSPISYNVSYFDKNGTLIEENYIDEFMLLKPKLKKVKPEQKAAPVSTTKEKPKKESAKKEDWWNYE